jgi:hypothetical protein
MWVGEGIAIAVDWTEIALKRGEEKMARPVPWSASDLA